jgi:hypothetical protein
MARKQRLSATIERFTQFFKNNVLVVVLTIGRGVSQM